MVGWLAVNAFLNKEKFFGIHKRLSASAEKYGVPLNVKTNSELMLYNGENIVPRPDFVLFWDKDIRLGLRLEELGLRLFNSASAIEACDDKALTYLKLLNKVKQPKTIIAPFTYANIGYSDYSFLKDLEKELNFPIVVKECFGSFGEQVYLAGDYAALAAIVKKSGVTPLLFQEFVKTSRGRDIRLNVVGGKVAASMLREAAGGDFRANITLGGTMSPYLPSKDEIGMAVTACRELGLDFAGVDILFGEGGEPVLCEVNSNPHFKSIYDCTGIDVADKIMEYILGILN
jgi:RimK family alpha-L-glutamate ligase